MININVSSPNDGLGDKLRDAFVIVNANFVELQNLIGTSLPPFAISDIIGLQAQLTQLGNDISAISPITIEDVVGLQAQLTSIDNSINSISGSIISLDGDVTAIETSIDIINANIVTLNSSITTILGLIGALNVPNQTSDLINDGDGASAFVTQNELNVYFYDIISLNVSSPISPIDGQIWLETNTNTGLKIQINGVTKTITLT